MAYLSKNQLKKIGFKACGKNVLISDKASIYNHDKIEIGGNETLDYKKPIDVCIKKV
jgi:hypothetical protein